MKERMNINLIVLLVCMTLTIYVCESKRGGGYSGGSYRGGSYRSSSSRSSRSSSSSRYTSRMPSKYNVRGWTSRTKTRAVRAGTVFVAARLQRQYYRVDDDSYDDSLVKMDICRNVIKYPRFNSTQKVYGWFLCPTSEYSDSHKYCCGALDQEYCCTYWNTNGGIWILVLISFICVGLISYLVYLFIAGPRWFDRLLERVFTCCCWPCNFTYRQMRRYRARQEANRRQRERRQHERNVELNCPEGGDGKDETKNVAGNSLPPEYEECIANEEQYDVPGSDPTSVKLDCDSSSVDHDSSCKVKASAPSPSPPRYRSPSPIRSRSPDRHHSPVRSRSPARHSPVRSRSPDRHSYSSNHS